VAAKKAKAARAAAEAAEAEVWVGGRGRGRRVWDWRGGGSVWMWRGRNTRPAHVMIMHGGQAAAAKAAEEMRNFRITKQDLRAIFDTLDVNHDGSITHAEFIKGVRYRMCHN
jgi:hypothetical protein